MKRIISLILAVALILSIAILPAVASDKPDVKLDIVGFTYEDGKTITRPPQNMCKCLPA